MLHSWRDIKKLLKNSLFLKSLAKVINAAVEDCRRLKWNVVRLKSIKSYTDSYAIRKLQIGSGTNTLKGWLNTDLYPRSKEVLLLDVTRKFPIKDKSFDYIFSEHHIATLTYNESKLMLGECYRILKPGGKIRIAVLDLSKLIALYTPQKNEDQRRYIQFIIDKYLPEINEYNAVFVINNAFYNWGQKFIYDGECLYGLLKKTGFEDIRYYPPGESDDVHLEGIEQHGKSIGNEDINKYETVIIEAKRMR
jgi:predicted SAM-dependent methyltransferase